MGRIFGIRIPGNEKYWEKFIVWAIASRIWISKMSIISNRSNIKGAPTILAAKKINRIPISKRRQVKQHATKPSATFFE